MDFKKNVYDFTDLEIEIFYSKISSIISNRETDLNPKCIDKILLTINKNGDNKKILDVGCGEGYILNRLSKFCNSDNLYGSDFIEATNNSIINFQRLKLLIYHMKINILTS